LTGVADESLRSVKSVYGAAFRIKGKEAQIL